MHNGALYMGLTCFVRSTLDVQPRTQPQLEKQNTAGSLGETGVYTDID